MHIDFYITLGTKQIHAHMDHTLYIYIANTDTQTHMYSVCVCIYMSHH